MEKRHLDRRLEQMEAEGTEFRTNAVVGHNVDVDRAAGVVRRDRARLRRDRVARPAGARARAEQHPPGDGVPAVGEPRAAGRHRRLADRRQRQARRDHRRRRHRRRLPRHRPPPGRGVGHPARDPAPPARRAGRRQPVAAVRRSRSRSRRRTRRAASGSTRVNTERFIGDGDGHVACAADPRGRDGRRQVRQGRRHRPRAARRLRAAGDGLRRPGTRLVARRARRRVRRARQRRPRRQLHDAACRACSSPATWAAARA